MLRIVANALSANNINYSLCTNKNKDFGVFGGIECFRSNPDLRVLLLPLHLGAEVLLILYYKYIYYYYYYYCCYIIYYKIIL